jgi:Zeta toxin
MKTRTERGATLRLYRQVIASGLWVFLCLSVVLAGEDAGHYPGKLGIDKARHLSPAEREVEARFAAYLESHTDQAIARYIEKFGNEINTDNARELSSDYAPGGIDAEDAVTVAARTRWGEAVHEPASALAKELFRRALHKETPADRRKQVIFTAGGAGAGKTTSIRKLADLWNMVDSAEIVYDTTLASYSSAVRNTAQALANGRMVSIVFVYRDPIDALVEGVLPRAQSMGRSVPLEAILNTHIGSVQGILKLAEAYKNEPRLAIAIIDNRDGPGDTAQADLGFVRRMARKYSRESLREALSSALEDAYEKNKRGAKNGISETLYRAIKRPAP